MNVRFTSVAEMELRAAMEFYEAAQTGLGAKFLSEIEVATRLIEAHPLAWASLSQRTRRCRTRLVPVWLVLPDSDRRNLDRLGHGSTPRPEALGRIPVTIPSKMRKLKLRLGEEANRGG